MSEFSTGTVLRSPTGAELWLRRALPQDGARAILLLQHGLAEHAGRYVPFAEHLAARGIAIFAHDHRGHGQTRAADTAERRFALRDGADKVLADCRAVHVHALEVCGSLPVVVFGHSMGGLIALNCARGYGAELAGAAVWNASFDAGPQQTAARLALAAEKALKGSDVSSQLLARATFEAWGRSVENRRTMGDWLSHDEAQVDAYLADPLCGWTPTISMYEDILDLIFRLSGKSGLAALRRDLPMHLLSGSADPATARGAAVRRLAERLEAAGVADVTLLTIDGARHETLNELDAYRTAALASLDKWLDRVIARA